MAFLVFKYKVTMINYFFSAASYSRHHYPLLTNSGLDTVGTAMSLHCIEQDDYINKPLCPLAETALVPLGMLSDPSFIFYG
jgi:hypothetical protein